MSPSGPTEQGAIELKQSVGTASQIGSQQLIERQVEQDDAQLGLARADKPAEPCQQQDDDERPASKQTSPLMGRRDLRSATNGSNQIISSIGRSAGATETNANGGDKPPARGAPNMAPTYRQGSNLTRTISQSMLELDHSRRLNEFQVIWRNISFSYKPSWTARYLSRRTRANQVLRNVSGRFKSNQLVAIIGPSGCGKTTLLHFLAGNNGHQRDKLRIVGLEEPKVAFIGQDDCLLPGLTAKETLMFASRLQNNRRNFDHEQHIQPILNELGLLECSDRSVTKLSGGQARRVTIAQELLYPTNLLILDEVTSGLDASTSCSIVKLLKHLVSDSNYPMSIVMSIHQPSAKLFSVFDQVYVMSEGSCLYEGSCGTDSINDYLLRFGLECPKFHNIADYLIEIACEDSGEPMGATKEQMIQYQTKRSELSLAEECQHYWPAASGCGPTNGDVETGPAPLGVFARTNGYTRVSSQDVGERPPLVPIMNHSLHEAIEQARRARPRPFWDQFLVHLSRSLLRIRRSHILTYLQLVTYVVLGLQLATFYGPQIGTLNGCPRLPTSLMAFVLASDLDEHMNQEMRRIQENMNFLLVSVMTATFAALEITVITFPLEAKTVKREWRNGWYRVTSYFMGRTLADLPFQLVFVVIFCLLIYVLTGQIGLATWRFVSFVSIVAMTALIAQSFGFIFGAIFMNNLPAAVFCAPLCIFPTLLFSGFFSRVSQIPAIYRPMTYLSHFRYTFDALLVTLYGYQRCDCDQAQLAGYRASLDNQTRSMREVFGYLFGSAECVPAPGASTDPAEPPGEPPLAGAPQTNASLAAGLVGSLLPASAGTHLALEEALVDSVFEQLNSTTATSLEPEPGATSGQDFGLGVTDHLAQRFATRITTMLNKQANFGHPLPDNCAEFNSYLMTEFELRNADLAFGLAMLLAFVVLTRLVCGTILGFTIATRNN